MLANVLEFFGNVAAYIPSKACFFVFLDEPECPKSLIK